MVFLFCILIDVSQMHLIKIALQCKWFFGVFQKECDEVKNLHHKPEKKSVSGCKLFIHQSLA